MNKNLLLKPKNTRNKPFCPSVSPYLILIFGFFACNGTKQVNSVTKKLAKFNEKEAKTVAEPKRPIYLNESLI